MLLFQLLMTRCHACQLLPLLASCSVLSIVIVNHSCCCYAACQIAATLVGRAGWHRERAAPCAVHGALLTCCCCHAACCTAVARIAGWHGERAAPRAVHSAGAAQGQRGHWAAGHRPHLCHPWGGGRQAQVSVASSCQHRLCGLGVKNGEGCTDSS